jgi:hypothetical protein
MKSNQKKNSNNKKKTKSAMQQSLPNRPFNYASTSIGSSITTSIRTRMGVSDLKKLCIGWLAGYTYVGNNTLGTNDSVYYVDSTVTYTMPSFVPVLLADALLGQSYVTDIAKHFARVKITKLHAEFLSLNPSTSNSMVANVAPHRGGNLQWTLKTDTTAAITQASVLGAQGQIQIASWQNGFIDLTPYIAGGSGQRQDEFSQYSAAESDLYGTTAATADDAEVLSLLSPAGLAVSGSNATTALRGTKIHAILLQAEIDLLDFTGGISSGVSEGTALRQRVKSLEKKVGAAGSPYLSVDMDEPTSSTSSIAPPTKKLTR